MKNRIKYGIRFLVEKIVHILFSNEKVRNVASNSDYFISKDRLKSMLSVLELAKASKRDSLIENFHLSKSQLGQDLFVLLALDFKTTGFFVEFGATDGIELSNTFLLEKVYGWGGILAEPGKVWQSRLRKNRNVILDNRCVYSESGKKLEFLESNVHATLSGIHSLREESGHGRQYSVESVSLFDLLRAGYAPETIDYMSIDTEGSEFEILKGFDFNSYKFRVITVEHNFRPEESEIIDLLSSHGYEQVAAHASGIEAWFVNKAFDYPNISQLLSS